MIMICIIAFIIASPISSLAVKKRVLFEASYGKGVEGFGYNNNDYIDECSAVPSSFYVENKTFWIQDQGNNVLKIIDLEQKKTKILSTSIYVKDVLGKDSIIFSDLYFSLLTNNRLDTIFTFTGKNEFYSYNFIHSSGSILVATNENHYLFDSEYNEIGMETLPGIINDDDVLYLKEEKVLLSDCFRCLKSKGKKYIPQSAKNIENHEMFSFPPRTEWGDYFNNANVSMRYLGGDKRNNTYWVTNTDVWQKYEETYNLPEVTQDGLFYHKYQVNVQAIFCYDRLGQLLYWFPEPKLTEGWKHYCGDVVVNKQGRMFQMLFYSHINNEEIDKAKGIRIIEYIPEKDDYTHEGRVKKYGKKNN